MKSKTMKIAIPGGKGVSGLLEQPRGARACYVLAHGAGAGMKHPFLAAVAAGLAQRRIATLRYNFPYMERRSRSVDKPEVAHAAVRAAVKVAARTKLPLFAGGKSFGGRMTSQAQAESPLPGVRGLVFLGFPLHPPGKPDQLRDAHLPSIHVPVICFNGTRDPFCTPSLMEEVLTRVTTNWEMHWVEGADHSFHVLKSSGKTDAEVQNQMSDTIRNWVERREKENENDR